MTATFSSAGEIVNAFPCILRQDVLQAFSAFPGVRTLGRSFSVQVGYEIVTIPKRVHFDAAGINAGSLSMLQREIVDCLLTRHTDGFVRQRCLTRIVSVNHVWIPPFVVQLAGEYVVEMLDVIYESIPLLNTVLYREFFDCNPAFLNLIGQRIMSYWDCYYRNEKREEYVGFKILEFFRSLQRS
jgi:hypothetical protein